MPYHAIKDRKSFRIVHESWRDGVRTRRSVPINEWVNLGIDAGMPLDKVRDTLRHLSSVEIDEAKRQRALKRVETNAKEDFLYLPAALVKEFEQNVINQSDRPPKLAHWMAAKRLIRHIALPPKDWKFNRKRFYQWLRDKPRRYSPDYCTDILRMVNAWGEFLAYKTNSFWAPIPPARGPELTAIRRAYYAKSKGGRDSARLSWAALQSKASEIPDDCYRWLRASVLFGLRPEEIDRALTDPQYHRVDGQQLVVFQFKLERLGYPWKLCWKRIDAHLPDQISLLSELAAGKPVKRPGRKRLKKWFGERVGYYAGRKEFAPWMRRLGFSAYQVMRWLGHQDLTTLRRNYDKADTDAPDGEAA